MDIDAYLRRIDYRAPLTATAPALHALHAAHLLAVPFENLDIHLGRPIALDADALYAKVVDRRRGGFCFELNGLFADLLRQAGFAVTLVSAGVANGAGEFSPPFDHLALLVEAGERWLVDVGFGDSFHLPLRLDDEREQVQERGVYRLSHHDTEVTLLRQVEASWKAQYRFTLQPRALSDFAERCVYHQTSPDSVFTQKRLCTRATPDGRITLSDGRLLVTRAGAKTEQALDGEDAYRAALRRHFGIDLGG